MPRTNADLAMSPIAKLERRCDRAWGVVNPGNALCCAIFRTKREAVKFRREQASAYVVVPVTITPEYGGDDA